MYLYVCMYALMYMYVCICICLNMCMYKSIHACLHTYYIYIYIKEVKEKAHALGKHAYVNICIYMYLLGYVYT
jgi:hypothetical protein